MVSSQEFPAPELFRCYHCGVESSDCSFKYFDNKKEDQPRYKCHHCLKFFTLGLHGRPQGKTYAKKRNEDPAELKSLPRQCRHCGVADNAVFKYYNNHNLLQPRFKCLSCKKQFQMRLLGTGEERHLVHTSAQQRSAPRRRKQGVSPEIFPGNASSSSEDGSNCQPVDGSFMQADSEMCLEPRAELLPEMSDHENAPYCNFLEGFLTEESECDSTTWTGNISFMPAPSDPLLPPEMVGEDAVQYSHVQETELALPEENYEPFLGNASCSSEAYSMSFESGAKLLPEMSDHEDVPYCNFMAMLMEESEADSTSWTGNASFIPAPSDPLMPPEMVGEDALQYSLVQETELAEPEEIYEPFPGNASSSSEDGSIYQPFDGSFMPLQADSEMSFESGAQLLPEMSDHDDVEDSNFVDTVLTEEPGTYAAPSDPLMPPEMSAEDAVQSSQVLETELAEPEENTVSYADAAIACCRQMDLEMAALAEPEENNMSYADAAIACYRQMDLEMAALAEPEENNMSYTDTAIACCRQMDLEMAALAEPKENNLSSADAAIACCRQMDLEMQTAPSWIF